MNPDLLFRVSIVAKLLGVAVAVGLLVHSWTFFRLYRCARVGRVLFALLVLSAAGRGLEAMVPALRLPTAEAAAVTIVLDSAFVLIAYGAFFWLPRYARPALSGEDEANERGIAELLRSQQVTTERLEAEIAALRIQLSARPPGGRGD